MIVYYTLSIERYIYIYTHLLYIYIYIYMCVQMEVARISRIQSYFETGPPLNWGGPDLLFFGVKTWKIETNEMKIIVRLRGLRCPPHPPASKSLRSLLHPLIPPPSVNTKLFTNHGPCWIRIVPYRGVQLKGVLSPWGGKMFELGSSRISIPRKKSHKICTKSHLDRLRFQYFF